jgi:UDP-N-acetylglucosamine--N-acetylmuramyl-(pentapeptide) pyrophosphoryl-undecaprenol N-acetylglucosamine transferase
MTKKRIIFTGGGSAGHVTPNIAIINELNSEEWDIQYIGSKNGIEKEIIEKIKIPYFSISSGKLRRYMDWDNVKDFFRVLKGCLEARKILKTQRPSLVFSKGGFVSVPVILAAKSLNIPIFIHESDMTPGLANSISKRFAAKIFTSFEEAVQYFPNRKTKAIGSPIRKDVLSGSKEKGLNLLGFQDKKPVIVVMGGSLGAKKINDTMRSCLKELLQHYQIVHLCGKGNLDKKREAIKGYRQFEYIHDELPDILASADFVITRGGSNAIFEFLALNKPMIIIPLTRKQSRGDQILNAKSFEKKGYSITLEEEDLTKESLYKKLKELHEKKMDFKTAMKNSGNSNALNILLDEINKQD